MECWQCQHNEKQTSIRKNFPIILTTGLSCCHSVSVCFVSSRSSCQRCMYAWSKQWHVFDQEDRTKVAVCHHQKTGWRQNEFQSKSREGREVQSREWRGWDQDLSPVGYCRKRLQVLNSGHWWSEFESYQFYLRIKPWKTSARNDIERLKFVEENTVVHNIESRRQIKKS